MAGLERTNYDIRIDRSVGWIRMTWTDPFWTADVFASFRRDMSQAYVEMGRDRSQTSVLVDARNAVVQSQQVFEGIRQMTATSEAARIAFVVDKALLAIQTRRLGMRDNVRLFTTMDAAERWLSG